jgi:UDP-glucose 4-epimerase
MGASTSPTFRKQSDVVAYNGGVMIDRAHGPVLVTGGSGFIGSHVVDQLLAAGLRPRIYDLRPTPWHRNVEVIVGDLAELERLSDAMSDCSAVIHLAASADVNEVLADPVEAERRNARGTLQVLEAVRRTGVSRIVYASTIWAYSDTPAERHDESLPLHPPAHLYTATKLAGELYCHSYGELYGVEHTILRFGIPYGPRARPAAVVPAFTARALAGEPLTIAGDGSQTRRFVYVEDLADGVVRALAPAAANRTYNLVGSEDTSVREIALAVRDAVGTAEIVHGPGRTGDFAGAPVSGARAQAELGWTATTPFAEGVRRYVDWHRSALTAPAARRAERPRLAGAIARRSALALAGALLTALVIIGVATLAPIDSDMDAYDTFASALLLMLPVVLAGGFEWAEHGGREMRTVLAAIAAGSLALALLPWPPELRHLRHGHETLLVLFALSTGLAARLTTLKRALPAWLNE